MSQVLTRDEAARVLGCSKETIDRMRKAGRLPSIHLAGRSVRIPKWAIEGLLRGGISSEGGEEPRSVCDEARTASPR